MADLNVEVREPDITVAYTELDEGQPITLTRDGEAKGSRVLRCAFEDSLLLAKQLLGGAQKIGEDSILVTRPQAHPRDDYLRAVTAALRGRGASIDSGDSTVLAYDVAEVEVEYEYDPAQAEADDPAEEFVEESMEGSVEFLTQPSAKFFWDNAQAEPVTDAEEPGVKIPKVVWSYTRNNMPYVPSEAVSLIGYTNSVDVTSRRSGITFAEGTLLYLGPSLSARTNIATITTGATLWSVTYQFEARRHQWNKFPKRGEDTFQTMYKGDGTAFEPFPGTTFDTLIG